MATKIVKFSGVIEKAYGKPLDSYKNAQGEQLPASHPYEAEYVKFLDEQSVKDAGQWPDVAACIKLANVKNQGKARAAANAKVLETLGVVKPTIENDTQLRLRNMAALFEANGESKERARQLAATSLNLKWDDEDSDDDSDSDSE